MMGLCGGLPKTSSTTLFLLLSLVTIIGGIRGQSIQTCPANLVPPSIVTSPSSIVSSPSSSTCKQVGVNSASPAANYNLWFTVNNLTSPHTLSIILSVPRESEPRWYGMGFNPDQNRMVGTDAIIFWLNGQTSQGVVGTYYLTEQDIAGVNPDTTRLNFTAGNKPKVVADANNLYLTFVVEQSNLATFAYQNFVIGAPGDVPTGQYISGQQQHQGESSVQIDFVTGSAVVTTVNADGKRSTHGVLSIIGWGVLLPIGVIVARYARAFDPHWFYFHAFSQIVGFGFVLAGSITGFNLQGLYPDVDIGSHKALGVVLIIMASVQISAVLIRPKKEAKLRRYWNWGHFWLGRAALVIGAVNIFVGIHVTNTSSVTNTSRGWNVAYAVVLASEVLVVVILESLLWMNYFRTKRDSLPKSSYRTRDTNGASAPTATSEMISGKV